MTQVNSIDFAVNDGIEYIKVTFKDDSVILLDTDAGEGKQGVLNDLDRGEFDYFAEGDFRDTPRDIAKWDKQHPAVERIFG